VAAFVVAFEVFGTTIVFLVIIGLVARLPAVGRGTVRRPTMAKTKTATHPFSPQHSAMSPAPKG